MDLKLFQEDVAKIIGVCTDSVTYWENGRAVPQIHHMPSIIEFLGYNPSSIDTSTLSGKIKAFRIGKGITHKALARILGVDGSTVGAWENEESIPKPKTLKHLLWLLRRAGAKNA